MPLSDGRSHMSTMRHGRPRVGISRCLLGDDVRWDGTHTRDPKLARLTRLVEWVPVCPEVEVGMGVPREPIQLVASATGVPSGDALVRLVGVSSGTDWTTRMSRFSQARVRALAENGIAGFVVKARSPSCGLDVPVHQPAHDRTHRGRTRVAGRGLFAEALRRELPDMPVAEETALHDAESREHFLERVFAFWRIHALWQRPWAPGALVRFHAVHKLQLLAHARDGYMQLGRLVASLHEHSREELAESYQAWFMRTIGRPSTPGRHADVMLHALGHVKRLVTPAERQTLLEQIDRYRRGAGERVVPLRLLREYAVRYEVKYLLEQTYLTPLAPTG